jgi:PiT family inorganic phosphate transporter
MVEDAEAIALDASTTAYYLALELRAKRELVVVTNGLLVATALDIRWGLVAIAVAMAVGGLLNARKVADTMSTKITGMNPGQGFAANLATALLVNTASYHGLPVSTTHVSVGSLLGIGITTRQAKWKPVLGVLLSWVITLPCAALLAALSYSLLRQIG